MWHSTSQRRFEIPEEFVNLVLRCKTQFWCTFCEKSLSFFRFKLFLSLFSFNQISLRRRNFWLQFFYLCYCHCYFILVYATYFIIVIYIIVIFFNLNFVLTVLMFQYYFNLVLIPLFYY